MKQILIFALGASLTLGGLTAHAQIYQWKDANGKTVISDTPPPSNAKGSRAIGAPTPSVSSEKAPEKDKDAGAPKTMVDKEMEFKKRQQENRDKAEKQAKEDGEAKEKARVCEQARRNLAALQSNQGFTVAGPNGEQQMMDDSARQQEIQRLIQQMNEACK